MTDIVINTQMKKGILEYIILAMISKGEMYASDILARLKDFDLIVVEGTLYPLLSRLKTDGLLNYKRVESQQWPPRKYYILTDKWDITLWKMRDSRASIADIINKIDTP